MPSVFAMHEKREKAAFQRSYQYMFYALLGDGFLGELLIDLQGLSLWSKAVTGRNILIPLFF